MTTSAFGVEHTIAKGLAPGMAPLASNGGGVDMVGAGAHHTGKQAAVYQAKKQKKFPNASSNFSGSPLYGEGGRVGLVGDGAHHSGRLSAVARAKKAAKLTEGLAKANGLLVSGGGLTALGGGALGNAAGRRQQKKKDEAAAKKAAAAAAVSKGRHDGPGQANWAGHLPKHTPGAVAVAQAAKKPKMPGAAQAIRNGLRATKI